MGMHMQRSFLRAVNLQFPRRRFCSSRQQVRVRFAPSPTGFLHLGGLRTALYNYLFARANNGVFILRIEDTDQSRVVPGAMEKLQNDLAWSGIIADEDPIRGGPKGPYLQSKRLDLYKEQVLKLLENESAYYCFCSEHRLEMLRKEAIAIGQVPKYNNKCRNLSKEEAEDKMKKGMKPCIRFKLTPTTEPFMDLVYGEISYDVSQIEGDPVIVKADDFPTYHFANVVDDHFMEISHVLRGVEWQISTQKHLLLYKAFGWDPPLFGHLPLILNPNGSKLSKRQKDIHIEHFRNDGIFPLALLNYVTNAGGGFDRNQGSQQCYSYEELIKQFNISRVNPNSSKLMPNKLLEFNKLEISNLLKNKKNSLLLTQRVKDLVKEKFPDRVNDGSLRLDDEYVSTILTWAHNRISKLPDLVSDNLKFLWVMPSISQVPDNSKHKEVIKVLKETLSGLNSNDFNQEVLKPFLKDFAKHNKVPFPELMLTLRGLLSGLKEGPSIGEMMEILGKDATLSRLK